MRILYAALAATAYANLPIDCEEKAECAILTVAASKCLTPCFREAQACFGLVGAMIPKIQQCMIDYDGLDFKDGFGDKQLRSPSCNVCIDSQMVKHCANYKQEFVEKCGREPEGTGDDDPCKDKKRQACIDWSHSCTWDQGARACLNNNDLDSGDDGDSGECPTCPECPDVQCPEPEPKDCDCGARGSVKKGKTISTTFTETACECHEACMEDEINGWSWEAPRNKKQARKGGKCECLEATKKTQIKIGKYSSENYAHFYGI